MYYYYIYIHVVAIGGQGYTSKGGMSSSLDTIRGKKEAENHEHACMHKEYRLLVSYLCF